MWKSFGVRSGLHGEVMFVNDSVQLPQTDLFLQMVALYLPFFKNQEFHRNDSREFLATSAMISIHGNAAFFNLFALFKSKESYDQTVLQFFWKEITV